MFKRNITTKRQLKFVILLHHIGILKREEMEKIIGGLNKMTD
jgi:argininosuccinate lyase